MKNSILGVLYTTVNDNATAEKIVVELLQQRLIACANIIQEINAMYWWDGEICKNKEVGIILKTNKNLIHKAFEALKSIHPYKVPCVIEFGNVESHNADYTNWILKEVSK
jgi:periplasmic divalent cation tolerance protein